MEKKNVVSIIIPAYNMENYIEKCISSIINQTYKQLEIIIVDDGSTDRTLEICKEKANSDKRIKVLSQKNSGQSVARNRGIEIAKGKYIGFVDADDWIDENFFENLVNTSEEYDLDMCVCNRRVFSEENKLLYEMDFIGDKIYSIDDINEYFYNYFFQYTPVVYNRIYKREIWKEVSFLDLKEVGTEDTLVNFQIMFRLKRVGEVTNTFYNNLDRTGSTARTYRGGMLYQNLNLWEKCVDIVQKEKMIDMSSSNVMCLYVYNFFQQRAWKYIYKYAHESYEEILEKELLEIQSHPFFKKVSWAMFSNKKLFYRLKQSGYRGRGIFLIKVLYCLQAFKVLNVEKKIIEKLFMK